jgi:hypothetical protein
MRSESMCPNATEYDDVSMSPPPLRRSVSIAPCAPMIKRKVRPLTMLAFEDRERDQRQLQLQQELLREEPEQEPPVPAQPKKKIIAPPMKYDLLTATPTTVYNHMLKLTQNDTTAANYVESIKPMLAAQREIVFGYIPAPPNANITRQVIGLKGYFFKMTTACCGVYFIWHDHEANVFLFWGPSTFKVVKAMNSIRWRIFKYCEVYTPERSLAPEPEEDDGDDESDEYADMPGLISMGNSPDYEHPEQC